MFRDAFAHAYAVAARHLRQEVLRDAFTGRQKRSAAPPAGLPCAALLDKHFKVVSNAA